MKNQTITTDMDMDNYVTDVLSGSDAEFDTKAITEEMMARARYNGREFIDYPTGDEFWAIALDNLA
jgi:hypothetical protein